MHCSKIGGQCPHPTTMDNNLVFVMMPFRGFDNIYDAIEMAVKGMDEKSFRCERADAHYTNLSIWCDRICKNIRRAKYLIADATGQNANVYYELGFAHASENTQVILITQDDLKEAPFDIADLNHIHYSANNLKALREELHSAILTLEKREEEESYAHKTTDEVIVELNRQLRDEEERSRTF